MNIFHGHGFHVCCLLLALKYYFSGIFCLFCSGLRGQMPSFAHIFSIRMLSLKIFFKERKYFAPAFLYSCFALVFSTWIIYIPFLAEKLQITEGQIGTALFFASVGSFVMIPLANRLTDVLGVGRQAYWGYVLYGTRSEERRVGKECRSRWSRYHEKKKSERRMERVRRGRK